MKEQLSRNPTHLNRNPWNKLDHLKPKIRGEQFKTFETTAILKATRAVNFETGASIHQLAGNEIINEDDLVVFLFMIHERSSIAMAGR